MKIKCPKTPLHPNRQAERRFAEARWLASLQRLETKRMKAWKNVDRLAPTCWDKFHYPRRARYWMRTARRLWEKQNTKLANAELSDAGGQSASASQKDVARPHSLQ